MDSEIHSSHLLPRPSVIPEAIRFGLVPARYSGEHPGDHNHHDFHNKALRYEWEAYCNTNGRHTAIQMGGVLTRLEVYCETFLRSSVSLRLSFPAAGPPDTGTDF